MVAFEIARQLNAANQKVGLLALLDCEAPLSIFHLPAFLKCAKTHVDRLRGTDLRGKLDYVAMIWGRRIGVAAFCVKYRIYTKLKGKPPQDYRDLPHVLAIAEQRYIAKSYPGAAVLLRTADVVARFPDDSTLGWGTLVRGGLDIRDIPGDHYSIMREPYVQTLADHLRAQVVCAT